MENIYYLDFNVTGSERKRLVSAISTFTGDETKYCGAPSFAYEVGAFHIDRNGVVSFAQRDQADGLTEALVDQMRWRCPSARIIGTSELVDWVNISIYAKSPLTVGALFRWFRTLRAWALRLFSLVRVLRT